MGKAQNKEVNNKELIKLKDSGEEPKKIRSEKLKKTLSKHRTRGDQEENWKGMDYNNS